MYWLRVVCPCFDASRSTVNASRSHVSADTHKPSLSTSCSIHSAASGGNVLDWRGVRLSRNMVCSKTLVQSISALTSRMERLCQTSEEHIRNAVWLFLGSSTPTHRTLEDNDLILQAGNFDGATALDSL